MSDHQGRLLAESWQDMRQELAAVGFNLSAALDCQALNRDTDIASVPESGRLLMFAAGGNQFWRQMHDTVDANGKPLRPDPDAASKHVVDDYCVDRVNAATSIYLHEFEVRLLYPGRCEILLPALGEYIGWSSASPLGLGIHSRYGLWWAYRVLYWTDAPIPVDIPDESLVTPCSTCVAKPCVAACPAEAVSAFDSFDLVACAQHRTSEASVCADRCLARLACPVGPDQRQDLEQHQYHQRRSMRGLLDWLGQ